MNKISIVIPYYNGANFINKTLDSILNQKEIDIDYIIIVDNSSVKEKEFPKEHYSLSNLITIKSSPIGFGKACNLGAKKAIELGANYILFLNQDAYLEEYSSKYLIEALLDDQNNVASNSMLYTYDLKAIESFFVKFYLIYTPELIVDLLNNKVKKGYNTQEICGASFLIRSSFILKHGLFDERYKMYYEDTALSRKIIFNKKNIVLAPNAKTAHYHSNTSSSNDWRIKKWKKHSNTIFILSDPNIPLYYKFLKLLKSNLTVYLENLLKLKIYHLFIYIFIDVKAILRYIFIK